MRVFTGTWKLELHVNGKKLATMPCGVMTKRDADLNRAPVVLKRVNFATSRRPTECHCATSSTR